MATRHNECTGPESSQNTSHAVSQGPERWMRHITYMNLHNHGKSGEISEPARMVTLSHHARIVISLTHGALHEVKRGGGWGARPDLKL